MKFFSFILSLYIGLFNLNQPLFSQTTYVMGQPIGTNGATANALNGSTVTINCGVTNIFQDPGGTGNYSNGESYTVTFCSGSSSPLYFDFMATSNSLNLDAGTGDSLYFYNTATGALISTLSQSDDYAFSTPSVGTNCTCVTVKWVSNSSGVDGGWDGLISCTPIPPSCSGGNPPAADVFLQAPTICNLDGYCGTTSSYYGEDAPYNFGGQGGGCPAPDGLFGGTLQNNSWLNFQATTTSITFTFTITGGGSCNGVQAGVFGYNIGTQTFSLMSPCASTNGSGLAPGVSTLTATGLVVGQIYYLMMDGNAGSVCDYVISAPPGSIQVLNAGVDQSICLSQSATLTATGPTGAIYTWTDLAGNPIGVGATQTVTPLVTTSYVVSASGVCTNSVDTILVTVGSSAAPTASVSTQPTCATPTGTITVTAPAPGAGITYTLTGTAPVVAPVTNSTGVFSGLAPGNYTVSTTVAGCNSTTTALTVNAVPAGPAAPTASVSTQPTCAVPTGTITVTVPAPGAGITYTLTGTAPVVAPVTNATGIFSGLAPGNYTVSTTVAGCTSTTTALTVNAVPAGPAAPTASVSTQPTCATPTGTITVTVPAPGAGITYTLTGTAPVVAPVTNATGIFSGLAAGNYTVTTTVAGCTSTTTALTVNAAPAGPAAPTASVTTQPTCAVPVGTITVTLPAPGAGITYTLTGTAPVVAPVTNATGIFSGLAAGNYTVTTTVAGCTSTTTALTVNPAAGAPAAPTASITTQPTCVLATGTATVTAPAPATGITYTIVGTAPVVAPVTNATGIFTGLTPGSYSVVVTIAGCNSGGTPLTVNAQPVAPAAPTATVSTQPTCAVSTGTITVTVPAPAAGTTYTLTGTAPVVAPQTNATGIFTGLASGDYTVTATVGGCTSPTTALTVNAAPATPAAPTASITTQPTCATPTGTATVTVPAPAAGTTYTITGTAPVVAPVTNTTGVFSGLTVGDYTVTTTVGGCTSPTTALIVNPIPNAPASPVAAILEQPSCLIPFGSVEILSPIGINYLYSMDGGVGQPSIDFTNLSPGQTFSFTVTDNITGCTSSAFDVTINSVPAAEIVDAGPDYTIQSGETITLTANGNGIMVWDTGDTIITNVTPISTTTYLVTMTDVNGCIDTDETTVFVQLDCGELFIPTAFSPNNDGINSAFRIKINPDCVVEMALKIYDRWGEIVFETTSIASSWDGKFKNKELDSDVFVYVLEIKLNSDSELKKYTGNLTLIK